MFSWFKKEKPKLTIENQLLDKIISETEEGRLEWKKESIDGFYFTVAYINQVYVRVWNNNQIDFQSGGEWLQLGYGEPVKKLWKAIFEQDRKQQEQKLNYLREEGLNKMAEIIKPKDTDV